MTRTQAIKALRSGDTLRTDTFLPGTFYPFHVKVTKKGGSAFSSISIYYHGIEPIKLAPSQVLSFIRRNYPR